MDATDFLFEFVLVEEWFSTFVHVQSVRDTWHHQFYELLGSNKRFGMIDDHRIDVVREGIANRSNENIALFVDIARCWRRLNAFDDNLPKSQQVCHVTRKFFPGTFTSSGSNDEANAFGQLHIQHHRSQFASFVFVFDLSAHTNASQGRHED